MSPLTLDQLIAAAKTALEAHPLFTGGRVPVLVNYVPPGERNTVREGAIRDKGACLEISPFLRDKLVAFKAPSSLTLDSTLSVAIRLSPTTPATPAGNPDALPLTLNTAFIAVVLAMMDVGFTEALPANGFKPEAELGHLVEDADGLLSKAVFFTARTTHAK
jgi:hypothetical protein